MAKKSTTSSTTVKKVVKKKATKKKATKKKVAKKKATSKRPAKKTGSKSRASSSVDTILTKYNKERTAQEKKLADVKKSIKELTAKVKSFEKQIVKLKKKQADAEEAICTVDTRRDQEVGEALNKLGINLDSVAAALENAPKKKVDKPTPLFDATEKKAQGDKQPEGSAEKSDSDQKANDS